MGTYSISDKELYYELKDRFYYKDGLLLYKKKIPRSKHNIGDVAGYIGNEGYRNIKINKVLYRANRLIFLFFNGYLPSTIDHVDGVRSNDRIENLRAATGRQNQVNRDGKKGSSSKWTGVTKRNRHNRTYYEASVKINNKNHYIGRCTDEADAATAWNLYVYNNFTKEDLQFVRWNSAGQLEGE